jgi:DNA-binding NtrC family response regulator
MSDIEFTENKKAKKILVVEDKQQDQLLIASAIKDVNPNVQVTFVPSLLKSYEKFMSENYDLILLDLNLPDGFGPATVKEMRSFNKNVPIIVITSLATQLTANEAMNNGATDFALKAQLNSDDFLMMLRDYL